MNCTYEIKQEVLLFQFVVYIPIFIGGLVLNSMALVALCWKLKRAETVIYMTNLATSDILLLFSLPFKIYSYKHSLPNVLCKVLKSVYFGNVYVSTFMITCICADRYIAILYPFKARMLRSPKKASIICAAVWIFSSLFILLNVFGSGIEEQPKTNSTVCFQGPRWLDHMSAFFVIHLMCFIVQFSIVTFCSVKVIHSLWKRNKCANSVFTKVRTIRILAANAITFAVCFTPIQIGICIEVVMKYMSVDCTILKHIRSFNEVTICIANINCCLDGFIFYFITAEIRESIPEGTQERENYCKTTPTVTCENMILEEPHSETL
eukprot:gi/632934649/ref/XP_007885819.1/ PREDICTED: lysophosphatidic acid receptor 6-like [Callorhinchus milii]